MLRLMAFAAAAALVSTAARAGDAAPAPAMFWSGLYAGIQGTGVSGDANVDIPLYPVNFDLATEGLGAGAFAGFNAQFNQLVIGLEGDGTWLVDANGSAPTGGLGGTERYDVGQKWEASARGRIGVAFDNIGFADRIQFFGTGGAAFTGLQTAYTPA